jgi:hypothetical protein
VLWGHSQTIMCHQHPASPSRKRFAIRTCIRSLIGVYIESIHMVFKPSTDNHTTCTLWQHPAVPGTQVSGSSTLHCSLGVSGATIRSRRVSPKVTPYTGSLPERLSTLLTSCVSLDLAPTSEDTGTLGPDRWLSCPGVAWTGLSSFEIVARGRFCPNCKLCVRRVHDEAF